MCLCHGHCTYSITTGVGLECRSVPMSMMMDNITRIRYWSDPQCSKAAEFKRSRKLAMLIADSVVCVYLGFRFCTEDVSASMDDSNSSRQWLCPVGGSVWLSTCVCLLWVGVLQELQTSREKLEDLWSARKLKLDLALQLRVFEQDALEVCTAYSCHFRTLSVLNGHSDGSLKLTACWRWYISIRCWWVI